MKWSEKEINILKQYRNMSYSELSQLLPNRTIESLRAKRHELNLKLTPEERFWSKVDKDSNILGINGNMLTPCWVFKGTLLKNGYAQIKINKKKKSGHRFVWELVNGPIPEGMCVLHKCDNRNCVRPDHLFLGTQKDNINDMFQKNRANKAKKFNDQQFRQMINLYNSGIYTKKKIQEMYGISRTHFNRILKSR